MLETKWRGGSLQARISLVMALVLLPLATSAVAGYFLIHHGVIGAYRDVAQTQHAKIDPVQRLQIALFEADDQLSEYLATEAQIFRDTYRKDREQIEAEFAQLRHVLSADSEERTVLESAYGDWTAANIVATDLIAGMDTSPTAPAGSEITRPTKKYEALIRSTADKLRALDDVLSKVETKDYLAAHLAYERSQWIAGIAGLISLMFMMVGLSIFGRLMKGSIDRLVEGAARFAAGDRDYRIEIQVPPELRKVANEFNRMIERIHVSEDVLADQASRDGLTGLQKSPGLR